MRITCCDVRKPTCLTLSRLLQLSCSTRSDVTPLLRADPGSRCATLLLPATGSSATLGILPLFQDQAEIEAPVLTATTFAEGLEAGSLPYAPSIVLDLAEAVSPHVANVIDLAFLPGFNEPTLAILFQPNQTCTGRLENARDTCRLIVVTLDVAVAHYPIILETPLPLPYDCLSLYACPTGLGGVLILTSNAVIHVDMSSKIVGRPVNGWHKRTSALPLEASTSATGTAAPPTVTGNISLESAHIIFLDALIAALILQTGELYVVRFTRDGRSLASIEVEGPLALAVVPSLMEAVGRDHIFVASAVGDSTLLRWRFEGTAQIVKDEDGDGDLDLDLDIKMEDEEAPTLDDADGRLPARLGGCVVPLRILTCSHCRPLC